MSEPMPQTEVMYHDLFFVVEAFDDAGKVFRIIDAMPNALRQGSCTGKGLSTVTLLCTGGEAATVAQAVNEAGIDARIAWQGPHRPSTWSQPSFRDNWPSLAAA